MDINLTDAELANLWQEILEYGEFVDGIEPISEKELAEIEANCQPVSLTPEQQRRSDELRQEWFREMGIGEKGRRFIVAR